MTTWHGATAMVERHNNEVHKTYDEAPFGIPGEILAAAESSWLLRLEGLEIAPSFIGLKGRTLIMSYVGEPEPLPANWWEQAKRIEYLLQSVDAFHRDLFSTRWGDVNNVLVQGGIIRLIDWTWATSLWEPALLPAFAPHLGQFSDRDAIERVFRVRNEAS